MATINFYGLVYAIGSLLLIVIIHYFLRQQKQNTNLKYKLAIYLLLGTIIGTRLFYIIFYNPMYFINNPLRIFNIWQGGLSFHGGLLGVLLSSYLFSKKYNVNFLKLADILTLPFTFLLIFGKIANFINIESYGKITELPFCVTFKGIQGCRHPVQLYEAVKNIILLSVLTSLKKRNLRDGLITMLFIFLYSITRFLIDIFREYHHTLFGIGIGQYLNFITIIISGFYLIKFLKNP